MHSLYMRSGAHAAEEAFQVLFRGFLIAYMYMLTCLHAQTNAPQVTCTYIPDYTHTHTHLQAEELFLSLPPRGFRRESLVCTCIFILSHTTHTYRLKSCYQVLRREGLTAIYVWVHACLNFYTYTHMQAEELLSSPPPRGFSRKLLQQLQNTFKVNFCAHTHVYIYIYMFVYIYLYIHT